LSEPALTAEDRLDILELLVRADDAASRRDVEGYLALFTDDATLEGDKGVHRGKDELRSAVAAVWATEAAGSRHLTLNSTLHAAPGTPPVVNATSTLAIVTAGDAPALQSIATILQVVGKVDGSWRIRRRTVRLS
jgi:uncharacterized protein (TIGR02246 family)